MAKPITTANNTTGIIGSGSGSTGVMTLQIYPPLQDHSDWCSSCGGLFLVSHMQKIFDAGYLCPHCYRLVEEQIYEDYQ